MKTVWITALTMLTLTPLGARADEWTHRWQVGGKPELHISAGDAAVVVEAGGEGAIDARLSTRGWSINDSGVRVTEHQSGNSVQIDVKVPNMHFDWGNHSIRLEVRVPRELMCDLHTGDGSIELRGLHGAIRADTGDGSIKVEGADGALDAHSGDGSVHVEGRFDSLQVHTQDGSVEVRAAGGSRMQGEWKIQTGDGSVQVRLPRELAADVELHIGDGHINFDFPITVSGRQDEHAMQGKLNGGGALLLVRTGDGSISMGPI